MSRAGLIQPLEPPPVTPVRRVIQEGCEGPAWRASIERRVAALETARGQGRAACLSEAEADARLATMLRTIDPEGRVPVDVAPAELGEPQFTVRPDGQGGLLLVYLNDMAWTLSVAEAGRLAAELRRAAVLIQQGAGEPG